MLHTICNMLKVLKSLADINLDFMKSYFTIKETPYTAYEIDLKKKKKPSVRSTCYRTNSILFWAC